MGAIISAPRLLLDQIKSVGIDRLDADDAIKCLDFVFFVFRIQPHAGTNGRGPAKRGREVRILRARVRGYRGRRVNGGGLIEVRS